MNRKRTPESNQPEGRVFSRPAIIAAVFLLLHMIPLVWRPNPSWGVDFLYYMPAPVQVAFVLLAVLLFVPRIQRLCRTCATSLPFALWGEGRRVWLTRTLVVLIALAGFFLLSTARHFLGDGYPLLEKLDAGIWSESHRAPLSWALILALHDIGQPHWETAENTYRFYSYASGVLYVLLTFPVAAAIGKTNRDKSIVFAFLLTAGYIQLFFGYVEHYPVFMPTLLLYLLAGLHAVKQRATLFVPACVLGLLIALHQAFTVFGPSLVFLAYRAVRQRQDARPAWKDVLTNIGALCCVPVTAALFVFISGIGFDAYISRLGGRNFLPLFSEPGYLSQYRILSLAHVLDFFNLQLLAAPAVCLSLFLVRRKSFTGQPFLTLCAVVPLFFTFLANPEIGAFRDWDVMALPALPLTLWAASALLQGMRHREDLFRGAFMICGAGALHGVLWIGLNANAGTAEDRFVDQLDRLKGGASVNGWLTMGRFHGQQGNRAAAHEAFRRSIEADPTNPNRWLTAGNFSRKTGQYTSAIGYFNKAVELNPDDAMPYMNLGAAYSDMRQFDKAIEFTRKAIALDPDLASAHLNLGAIYRKTAQHDKAIQHLEKASALRPNDGAIHGHLGMAYRSMGQNARAIRHLEKAHALRPDHTSTLVNLAVVCSDAGQNERAIELLERVVTLRPGLVPAYVNLGAVYGRIGQYKTGIRNLKRALELQPDNPETYRNLGLIYKAQIRYPDAIEHFEKALELQTGRGDLQSHLNLGDTYYDMGQHEKAIPHYQTAIQLNPNHANAHLLLGCPIEP
ncbi:MAG: tetratricopeptide repeat protein [Candidatus Latescibacteria bacterium]|nr:tetratricopeptide repeat protein [Candidatus Latescibacterota bacterium]